MSRYCSPNLVLLNGNETGVVHSQLKDFLFDDFIRTELEIASDTGLKEALKSAEAGIDVYLPDSLKHRIYGASLVSEDGTTWSGSHYSNVGYDSVTPIMASVIHWLNDYPTGKVSERHLRLSKLVVAGGPQMFTPFYRD